MNAPLVKQYEEEVDNIVVNDVFTLDDKQLWCSAVAEKKTKIKKPSRAAKKKQRLQ